MKLDNGCRPKEARRIDQEREDWAREGPRRSSKAMIENGRYGRATVSPTGRSNERKRWLWFLLAATSRYTG